MPRARISSASAWSDSTISMHVASSSALPGSNSMPAPVPSSSSASPPVRAAMSGAPPARVSRATMPNGSYSDGITTQPARWIVSRSFTSGGSRRAHDVAHTLDVDLRLEFGQVAAPAGDDALDVGHARAHRAHRPGEDLEPLLVLDAAPREHERPPAVGMLARRPPRRIDAVGHLVHPFRGDLEPGDHLAGHERRRRDDVARRVGDPRLDGVDRARVALRDAAAVAATRWCGTSSRAARRGSRRACWRPSRPASRGRGRPRASSCRMPSSAARGDDSADAAWATMSSSGIHGSSA